MILGRSEIVRDDDTEQCYPTCEEYDSGVDNFSSPSKYIIWSNRMNTHVLPACVVSFRVSSFKGLFSFLGGCIGLVFEVNCWHLIYFLIFLSS